MEVNEDAIISLEDKTELARLNLLLFEAMEDAINAGCYAVQNALGITTGDVAGVHFSGEERRAGIALALRDYIAVEIWLDDE